jgi:hypothetical protein
LGKNRYRQQCALTEWENALLADPNNSEELAVAFMELPGSSVLRQRLAVEVQAMNFGDRSWLSIADRTKNSCTTCLSPLV